MTKTKLRTPEFGSAALKPRNEGRRRRWVFNKPSLFLLMVLQPVCLFLGFVLLTEPCLNADFKPSLWDKRNYFTIIGSLSRSSNRTEWAQRFGKAGIKSLFGTAVIQAWFTARITAYIQKAAREEHRLITLLKSKTTGNTTAKESGAATQNDDAEVTAVGSFVRQMESVSVTFLVLPLVVAMVYAILTLLGAPLYTNKKQTAVLATHLTLLIGLPVGHILGLPPIPELSTKSLLQQSTAPALSSSSPTAGDAGGADGAINASKSWQNILALNPRPSYLLPLYYPLLGCIATTMISTATLALDWDSPWQTYPFPQLLASILGLALGNLVTLFIILFR